MKYEYDLDALEAAHAAATEGDWDTEDRDGEGWAVYSHSSDEDADGGGFGFQSVAGYTAYDGSVISEEDTEFIVLAHNMLPTLIARIRELEAEAAS